MIQDLYIDMMDGFFYHSAGSHGPIDVQFKLVSDKVVAIPNL